MVVNHILQKNCKVYTKNVRLHKNKKRSLCDLPMEKNSEVNRRGRDKKITPGERFWGQWAAPPQPAWQLHLRRGARGYGLPRAQSAFAMTI